MSKLNKLLTTYVNENLHVLNLPEDNLPEEVKFSYIEGDSLHMNILCFPNNLYVRHVSVTALLGLMWDRIEELENRNVYDELLENPRFLTRVSQMIHKGK